MNSAVDHRAVAAAAERMAPEVAHGALVAACAIAIHLLVACVQVVRLFALRERALRDVFRFDEPKVEAFDVSDGEALEGRRDRSHGALGNAGRPADQVDLHGAVERQVDRCAVLVGNAVRRYDGVSQRYHLLDE